MQPQLSNSRLPAPLRQRQPRVQPRLWAAAAPGAPRAGASPPPSLRLGWGPRGKALQRASASGSGQLHPSAGGLPRLLPRDLVRAPLRATCSSSSMKEPRDVSTPASSSSSSSSNPPEPVGSASAEPAAGPLRHGPVFLVASVAAVVVLGIANRLLYKMALTPMGGHVFFLAQLQTFGYVLIYFGVLFTRMRAGLVSAEELALPRQQLPLFLSIGSVEAVASLLGFVGAANLPGVVLPLLSQTFMFWQVLFAYVLLRKRLSVLQLAGVTLVVAGVSLAAWPGGGASPLANVNPIYAWIFVFSMLFPALDSILKERLFSETRQRLGRDLDIFVVNSFGSAAQALFVFALLPVMTALRGMSLAELPRYLHEGWLCFQGLASDGGAGGGTGAPLLPLLYVATNLAFNISALNLLRVAGNVVMSLVMSSMVPLTIMAFTVPLPFLPAAPPLGPTFLAGSAVLVSGLVLYNAPLWAPALTSRVRDWLAEGPAAGGAGGPAGMAAS